MQACGSGGTTAGLALGNHLGKFGWRISAYGVCDDPDYFYSYIQDLLDGMGATPDVVGAVLDARHCCHSPDQHISQKPAAWRIPAARRHNVQAARLPLLNL